MLLLPRGAALRRGPLCGSRPVGTRSVETRSSREELVAAGEETRKLPKNLQLPQWFLLFPCLVVAAGILPAGWGRGSAQESEPLRLVIPIEGHPPSRASG